MTALALYSCGSSDSTKEKTSVDTLKTGDSLQIIKDTTRYAQPEYGVIPSIPKPDKK